MGIPAVIHDFSREQFGADVELTLQPLRGGLEAPGTSRVIVRRDSKLLNSFVAKPLAGAGKREVATYQLLKQMSHEHVAPALLGWRHADNKPDEGYMFLEWVAADQRWPWSNIDASCQVIDRLAALHMCDASLEPSWDYDAELLASAESTVDTYGAARAAGVRPGERPMLPALIRLASNLQRVRSELMKFTGIALLHGDAHTGNVVLRKRSVLLLDWGRARIGSPLEDISSWIHSLTFWDSDARRKHDTLLKRYLLAKGGDETVSRGYRDAFLLAGACNALAGALRYHLCVLQDNNRTAREQRNSYRAATDWLRIIRRADECFAR
jgi:hypothetical protein